MTIFDNSVVDGIANDIGGTIAVAGQSQVMAGPNAARQFFCIQNQSTGDLYVNGQAPATGTFHSIRVAAGQYFECTNHLIGRGPINIYGALTAQAFFAREA